jgi:hypothetical protein
MTGMSKSNQDFPHVDDEVDAVIRDPDARERMGAHLDELRTQILWAGLVGLVVHIGAYLLRSTGPAEPLGLVADLLYSLGFALWTGTVVVALVEIIPQAKERQVWLPSMRTRRQCTAAPALGTTDGQPRRRRLSQPCQPGVQTSAARCSMPRQRPMRRWRLGCGRGPSMSS